MRSRFLFVLIYFVKSVRLLCLILCSLFLQQSLRAKDFGAQGQTFEIQERNLLHVIEERLEKIQASGKLGSLNTEIQQRVKKRIDRPNPVRKMKRTQVPRKYTYDPTLVVEKDLKDHNGKLIARKGKRINPLDYVSWGSPLLLIDGDDPEQVKWSQSLDDKLVLIKGSPLQLERQLQVPVYFDQGGRIVRKFGIRQVPCRISQAGKTLLVEELEPIQTFDRVKKL